MKDRIRELAEQAELRATLLFNKENLEKFADLIVAAEREACARVCETFINGSAGLVDNTAQVCADAIRARSEA